MKPAAPESNHSSHVTQKSLNPTSGNIDLESDVPSDHAPGDHSLSQKSFEQDLSDETFIENRIVTKDIKVHNEDIKKKIQNLEKQIAEEEKQTKALKEQEKKIKQIKKEMASEPVDSKQPKKVEKTKNAEK